MAQVTPQPPANAGATRAEIQRISPVELNVYTLQTARTLSLSRMLGTARILGQKARSILIDILLSIQRDHSVDRSAPRLFVSPRARLISTLGTQVCRLYEYRLHFIWSSRLQ